ncbi:MAG: helix-turn-helix transcriptional regulator [Hyphomonadaceae bacterium]|nr:helix-turn-helix transcriptional regulator [Hyphomonadaceae bacterium]
MPKSIFTGAHRHLVDVLTEARKEEGVTQGDLAAKVGKDQTFISLIERSQRRVDVLEFVALARAMGADPVELFEELVRRLPKRFEI